MCSVHVWTFWTPNWRLFFFGLKQCQGSNPKAQKQQQQQRKWLNIVAATSNACMIPHYCSASPSTIIKLCCPMNLFISTAFVIYASVVNCLSISIFSIIKGSIFEMVFCLIWMQLFIGLSLCVCVWFTNIAVEHSIPNFECK